MSFVCLPSSLLTSLSDLLVSYRSTRTYTPAPHDSMSFWETVSMVRGFVRRVSFSFALRFSLAHFLLSSSLSQPIRRNGSLRMDCCFVGMARYLPTSLARRRKNEEGSNPRSLRRESASLLVRFGSMKTCWRLIGSSLLPIDQGSVFYKIADSRKSAKAEGKKLR